MKRISIDWSDNAIGFMRLLMASMVLLGHATHLGRYPDGSMFGLMGDAGYGTSAVQGFMFLSGMLITRSMENCKGLGDFAIRRILRIFPGYWVCLILCAILFGPVAWCFTHGGLSGYAWTGQDGALTYPLKNSWLKMDQDFIRGLYVTPSGTQDGVNFPLWTIASEFMCYIGTGLLGIWGIGKKYRWGYLALAVAILGYLVFKSHGNPELFFVNRFIHVASYLVGVCAYYFHEEIRLNWALFAAAVVGTGFASRIPALYPLFPFAFGLVVMTLAFGLPIKGIERKADLSYGIYIYGWPVQLLVPILGGATGSIWLYLVYCLLLLCPIAALSWFLVEKPAMGRRKALAAWMNRKKKAQAEAS